jgi:hypothetical protein
MHGKIYTHRPHQNLGQLAKGNFDPNWTIITRPKHPYFINTDEIAGFYKTAKCLK